VTGANIHDSQVFGQLLEQVIEKVGKPTAVAVDAGYKTLSECDSFISLQRRRNDGEVKRS
ncbi:hypothetical protein, partial [Pallidibacillus thermolactis]|uniref:hypothetical protein n=1 Tax=Pallidibacillus thermolactis TaxID=251051 RepID=UPI002E1C2236|nr:hypothetical protein [Pallidibacillus thermolactis subsp. kokeshiiformis]